MLLLAAGLTVAAPALSEAACKITYSIELKGARPETELELRQGEPGHSKAIVSKKTAKGRASFSNLCPGSYFLVIGEGDYVEVGPVHKFENNHRYTSTIQEQAGAGNIERKSRKDL